MMSNIAGILSTKTWD
ncbi:hypothetical protein ACHAW5_007174 [Stephanodiscus triporus]|uniref:Uncharacterized protein n=1 Tax=Stephanodiscus triporus TaxID=2934178 RepID=A0ABD3P4A7_9STRA